MYSIVHNVGYEIKKKIRTIRKRSGNKAEARYQDLLKKFSKTLLDVLLFIHIYYLIMDS